MGKGTIISHIADGEYNVTVNYDTSAIDARILILSDRETLLESELTTEQEKDEPDEIKIKLFKLQILSIQKQIEFLQDTTKVPSGFTTTAWCADLTTDLSGEVGLIEIGRERENAINIQPGYDGNAVHSTTRDGQLVPLMAQTAPATFYNLAMLPGAQKWRPMFRYGTITGIDFDADTCDVALDAETSSQQGLNINQVNALTDVPIDYMSCNSAAFAVDDEVIVQFLNYDIEDPVVIGFKEEPQPCDCWKEPFETISGGTVSAYTAINDTYPWLNLYKVYDRVGGTITDVTASHPEAEPSAIPGLLGNDGHMEFALPSITVTNLYEYQNLWSYNIAPNYIYEGASRIKVDVEALIACYMDSEDYPDFYHQYIVYFKGVDGSGNAVEFDFIVVYNSAYAQPGSGLGRVGCSDGANTESAWASYTSGSTTVYCKNILNNTTDFIALPISGVNITSVNVYMLLYENSWVASDTTVESSMIINHIEIC